MESARHLPLKPAPWGRILGAELGPSHLVTSLDGRHAVAMISWFPVEQEIARLPPGERPNARTLRERYPKAGMYGVRRGVPVLLWSSESYVPDPARVLVPSGGRQLIWLDSPAGGILFSAATPQFVFTVEGTRTGSFPLKGIGLGQGRGGPIRVAVREDRGVLELQLPEMGWYLLSLEDGTVRDSHEHRLRSLRIATVIGYLLGVLWGLVRVARGQSPLAVPDLAVWLGVYACVVGMVLR